MDDQRQLNIGMVITYDLSETGGGVKQHARQLAEALRQRGDQVTLFGPSTRPIDALQLRGFRGVVDIASNGSGNRLGIFVSPLAMRRFICQQQFDVLHIHEPLPPVVPYYAAWLSPGVPKIATFHAYSERSSTILLAARKVFAPLILPFISRGIAVSEPASRHARIDWRGPLKVIPNGIFTGAFPPGDHRTSRSTLQLLFVGRALDKRKGLAYLLKAIARARAMGIQAELHLVGEQDSCTIKRLPPYVVHHGPLPEAALAAKYRSCDVFVAPSTGQESFGLVLLEAMSAARPIICSDIDGYRQAANPKGTRWVPPRDVEALSNAIVDLARHPDECARMGESNAKHVKQFEWSELAPRIRAEYLRTIADCQRTESPAPQRHAKLPLSMPSDLIPEADLSRIESREQGFDDV